MCEHPAHLIARHSHAFSLPAQIIPITFLCHPHNFYASFPTGEDLALPHPPPRCPLDCSPAAPRRAGQGADGTAWPGQSLPSIKRCRSITAGVRVQVCVQPSSQSLSLCWLSDPSTLREAQHDSLRGDLPSLSPLFSGFSTKPERLSMNSTLCLCLT